MTVKSPRWRTSKLLWGLVLLTIIKRTTEVAAVSNALAVALSQHVRAHTPSRADEGVDSVEERVFPVVETVGNELRPFAGKLIPKSTIDWLHMQNLADENMRKFDHLTIEKALDTFFLTTNLKLILCRKDLLIWFGIKSPEDQKVAINLLATKLRENTSTKRIVAYIFRNGKTKVDLFHDLTAAVERKWLMSKSKRDMNDVLNLFNIGDDNKFLKTVGLSIWYRFLESGKEDFETLMLTKLLERSKDEIMWARLIYKLQNEQTVKIPLSGVFDNLLRSYEAAPGDCRPSEAIKFLTSRELSKWHFDAASSRNKFVAVVRTELLKMSKDELMWAKLIYVLQDDQRAPASLSDVFDVILQPYDTAIYEPHQCTPSQAVEYLTGSKIFLLYEDSPLTVKKTDALLLVKLREMSLDELMWAKVLYMLQNEKNTSTIFSRLLKSLIESWTVVEKPTYSKSEAILTNSKFLDLYIFAHFVSDNPNVFVLNKLRERSKDELEWAHALNKLRKDPNVITPLSGVLDALLHSWIGRPYDAATATKSQHMLIDAYELLMSHALKIWNRRMLPTREEANALAEELLKRSNDELMWAKFLNKLQHDGTFFDLASSVFNALLLSYDATHAVHQYTPNQCANYLTSLDVPTSIASLHDDDASLLAQLLTQSSNEVMWAKVCYVVQNEESTSKPLISRMLTILLQSWMRPVHGIDEELNALEEIERFLKSQGFVNLFVFAHFSSDNPSVFLLEKLRERTADDLMWAKALNKLRKDQNVVTPLTGVLDALLLSWVGKPYDAAAIAETQHILINAYDYLTSQELATWCDDIMIIGGENVDLGVLEELLASSKDEIMWANFLNKLQHDKSVQVPLSDVLKTLVKSWNVKPLDAVAM